MDGLTEHSFTIGEIAFIGTIMIGEAGILWKAFELYKKITKSFNNMEVERQIEHKSAEVYNIAEVATKVKMLKDNVDGIGNISRTVTSEILEKISILETKIEELRSRTMRLEELSKRK